jgi:hypothetical protein
LSDLEDKATSGGHQRLADLIRQNQPTIVKEWTDFARTCSPASDGMSKLALDDHIVDILKLDADDLESSQTASEQVDKSRGLGQEAGPFVRARLKFIPLFVSLTVLILTKWYRNISPYEQASSSGRARVGSDDCFCGREIRGIWSP